MKTPTSTLRGRSIPMSCPARTVRARGRGHCTPGTKDGKGGGALLNCRPRRSNMRLGHGLWVSLLLLGLGAGSAAGQAVPLYATGPFSNVDPGPTNLYR